MKDDIARGLRETCPQQGYMVLVAIHVEGKTDAYPYGPDSILAAAEWAEQKNKEQWNIYWSVNPLTSSLRKKPGKADVKELLFVHADVDVLGEQKLQQLRAYTPPPTRIVCSGGGYQAFWRLRKPVPFNGNLDALEAPNRRVLQDLDPAHPGTYNLDRIMRCVGTVNWPTPTKLKKDPNRKPAQAYLIEDHPERVYALEDFGAPQPAVRTSASPPPVELAALNLPWVVHVAIETGDRPREPFNDRSAAMLWVAGELARNQIPRAIADALFQDPQYRIGDHARDQSDPARARARVLDKAYSENLDALTRLHEQHALVYVGPQILAMSKTDWDGALPALYHLRALAIEYKNQLLFGKTNPVDLWLASKTRTLYRRLVFQPGRVVDKNYFNTFTGWACVPRPGDCSLFLAHLREVICGRDEGLFQYVLQWLAHLVQFPGKLIGTALAMGSEPGAGKGSVYYYLREFLGRYAVRLDGSELIQNPFNDFLASRLLVFGDETLWHGDKRTLNRVKGYITEPTLVVNKKHVPVFEIENFARFIFSTNDALSAPLELKDRRYVPLPTLPLHIGDARYWEALYAERQAGGGAALLHHLLHEVRIERNLRTAPETAARAEQRLLNLEPVGEWWREMLMSEAHESRERNSSDSPRVTLRFGDVVRTADLHWLFVEWTQRTRKHAMSIDALGRRLRDYITLTTRESRKGELDPRPGESPRVKVYELPALVDARAQFERAVQCALDWDEGDTEPTL